ncbi:MAG: IS701 family transposase [Acidobacteria bacterium]|nr:IS701 family transposase [Acidobacteriota bacterium]MCA1618613.1 IS701 family transposase [Acidobacteriota bacterium]
MTQRTDESKAAVEEAKRWAQGLEAVAERIRGRFPRSESRERATAYLRGLISPVERKNGWQLAEEAGDETPYGVQHLLGRAEWSADEVRDDLRSYVVEHLGSEDAVLVVDETGFLKKGTKSAGVQRQYSGTAGRIENCQVGVFLAYATSEGRTFIDRELYLPKEWAGNVGRRVEAGVPDGVEFATKPRLARRMIARAMAAGVPFKWVTGDEVYGRDRRLRVWLEEQEVSYCIAVGSDEYVWLDFRQHRVKAVVGMIPEEAWAVLSCRAGAKGERLYEWAGVELLSFLLGERRRWLLVRRKIGEPAEMAYYVVYADAETTLEEMVRVAGARWAIEESFETAKGEIGLDQYEVRSWHGWYRHVTLCLLAHAYLTATRAEAARREAEKKRVLDAAAARRKRLGRRARRRR